MDQVGSNVAAADRRSLNSQLSSLGVPDSPQPATLKSMLSEAATYGIDETESLDVMVEKALECPCVADLRSSTCGASFTEAFRCFLKSTAEEKGSDCVTPFVQLQKCIEANPDAFSKDSVGEGEEKKDIHTDEEYKIIPPLWSADRAPSPRSKI